MTVLTKKRYQITGTFPSGEKIDLTMIHYTKALAIRAFLNLFCRSKR